MSKRLAVLTGLLVPLVIWAGDAVLPNTFSPGTLIKSSELNANFEALRDAVNAKSAGTRLKTIRVSSSDGFAQEVGLSAAGITPVPARVVPVDPSHAHPGVLLVTRASRPRAAARC
jgi:hypothetical protein